MGNFNRDYRSSSSSGGRDFNRGNRDREMHKTTCSNCGRDCEVPFKPNGSKPVFCSDCFERNGGRESNRFSGPDRDRAPRRPSFGENRSYDRPQNFDKPQHNSRPEQNNDQFASLNAKLDKIIMLLTPKPTYQESEKLAKPEIQSEKPTPPAPTFAKKKRSSKKTTPSPITE